MARVDVVDDCAVATASQCWKVAVVIGVPATTAIAPAGIGPARVAVRAVSDPGPPGGVAVAAPADVAVVAHSRKSFGGGLPELRRILTLEGVTDPLWYEVEKSRRAPKYARRAVAQGADVVARCGRP